MADSCNARIGPWQEMPAPSAGVAFKSFGDPVQGPHVFLIRQSPGYVEKRHWHESDTTYIVTRGELRVEGEGVFRPGDIRWVRRGVSYVEAAGPEGVEFWLFASGSPGMHYA